jgi:GNAT superfamily N-acetyltransferase
MYRIHQTDDEMLVRALHTICLPGDPFSKGCQYWVAWEGEMPVAFCSVKKLRSEPGVVFLNRSGVVPSARGSNLQRRMLNARVKWCRVNGIQSVITYAIYDNWPSIVNLLRSGFRFYVPEWKWAGDVHYFYRDL